nr:hypothetical protein BaRGS_034761 [Batillaria attramentaria]
MSDPSRQDMAAQTVSIWFVSVIGKATKKSLRKLDANSGTICFRAFCHAYWGCRKVDCNGCLAKLKDMKFGKKVLTSLILDNPYESEILKNYLESKGLAVQDVLEACLAKMQEGKYTCPVIGNRMGDLGRWLKSRTNLEKVAMLVFLLGGIFLLWSHHCPVCKTCILKRDHHCWFAGTCVGHANHRYFFVLIVYIVMAGVYCNLYNWSFVWSVKGEFSLWTIVSFIAPHVSIVLGYESLYSFLITSLSTIGFSLTFLFSWLLQIQLAQVVHGQTRYERKKGIKEYDQGLWENLRQILGNRMFLVFLFPWIPSSVPGDGTKFYSHSQKVI